MKKALYLVLALSLLAILHTQDAFSWCWIRDTGTLPCSGGYQQECCTGHLRKWPNATMTYRISTSTSDSLLNVIRDGISQWNEIQMSTFTFVEGARTTSWDWSSDGVNVINIDSQFCTHNGYPLNTNILGFSGCWSTGFGTSSYRATECDVILNGQTFTWGDGTGGTRNTAAVVAHEVGHDAGLTHPGSTCRDSGSSGCGPEVQAATMYWIASGPGNLATLELDDVASMVYGYPRSTVRIHVIDGAGNPISGAQVELLGTASPVIGSDELEGGSVYGDISASAFGDGYSSATYYNVSPFANTTADGYTNYIIPLHPSFQVRVSKSGLTTFTRTVTPSEGTSTVTVSADDTLDNPPDDPPVDPPVPPSASAALLWSHITGRAGLWNLDANEDRISSEDKNWGPYTGWTATSYQKLDDGTAKLLWSHTSGLAGLWTLDVNGNRIPSGDKNWGPYTGWTATSYQRLADGTAKLLWSHTSGRAGLWTLDVNGNRIPSGDKSWGPYTGWTATSYNAQ